jgi:hypothetical protein
MSILRHLAITAALLLAGQASATEISMVGGSVRFTAPDAWLGIMQTDGDPEARVFQVPDPSPTAANTLARVTVLAKQVPDMAGFQQYVSAASDKAKALPGYQPVRDVTNTNGPADFLYTAQEGGVPTSYVEHYWFHAGHAIQLRCLRPLSSQAGVAWANTFDKDCAAVAAQLSR